MEQLINCDSGNSKLAKTTGETVGFRVAGLGLSPYTYGGRGNLCPSAGACVHTCVLRECGRMVMKNVRAAGERKTNLFFDDRKGFIAQVKSDIKRVTKTSTRRGLKQSIRLNVATDLPFESIDRSIFTDNPTVSFYDYTKIAKRALNAHKLPKNYELTYSYSENSKNSELIDILEAGNNVAVITDTYYWAGNMAKIPTSVNIDGKVFKTVDGDLHDYRLKDIDGVGVVVILRGKGGRAKVAAAVNDGFMLEDTGSAQLQIPTDSERLTQKGIGISTRRFNAQDPIELTISASDKSTLAIAAA